MKTLLVFFLFVLFGAVFSNDEDIDLEDNPEEHDLEDGSEEHDLEDDSDDLEDHGGYYPKKKCHYKKVCKPVKKCYQKGYHYCKPKKICNRYIVRYARTCKKVCHKPYGYHGYKKCRKVCAYNKPIWKYGCRYFHNTCVPKVYCKKVIKCFRMKVCKKKGYY